MKRASLVVSSGVICLLVLGGTFEWWRWNSRVVINPYVKPPLKESDRLAQASYLVPCEKDRRCVPPLECVYDHRVDSTRCLTSECWTDAQCNPGYACRDIPFLGPSPFVLKMCVVEGVKKEGELCKPMTHDPKESCTRGLSCHRSRCGRPCEPGDASSCPVGFKCFSELNISTCIPDCQKAGCPAGERCYEIGKLYSVCGAPSGRDCDKDGCPEGQICDYLPTADHVVATWCRIPCEGDKDCFDGTVCTVAFGCLRRCSKSNQSCGPGFYCGYGPPKGEGQCYPH